MDYNTYQNMLYAGHSQVPAKLASALAAEPGVQYMPQSYSIPPNGYMQQLRQFSSFPHFDQSYYMTMRESGDHAYFPQSAIYTRPNGTRVDPAYAYQEVKFPASMNKHGANTWAIQNGSNLYPQYVSLKEPYALSARPQMQVQSNRLQRNHSGNTPVNSPVEGSVLGTSQIAPKKDMDEKPQRNSNQKSEPGTLAAASSSPKLGAQGTASGSKLEAIQKKSTSSKAEKPKQTDLTPSSCAEVLLNFSRTPVQVVPSKKRKYARDVPNIPSPVFKKDRLEPYNLGPVPDFIVEELRSTSGTGQFTRAELMITLLFAHQLLSQRNPQICTNDAIRRGNTYAIIKTRMGDRRSRASIRRKIEKIVNKDTGIPGGLLKEDGRVNVALDAIWAKFVTLVIVAEKVGTPKQKEFAKKLREYANSYVESNSSTFQKSGLRVARLRSPEEYSESETAELLKNINTRETGFGTVYTDPDLE